MTGRFLRTLRLVAITLVMLSGLLLPGAATAQQEAATEIAGQVSETTQVVESEADDGFDDWGLLGLLGLLGLAGLFRRPTQPEPVVDPTTNPIEQPILDRDGAVEERRSSDFI